MLHIPSTEQGLKNHYSGVKQRLGLPSRRRFRKSGVPGVEYEYRGMHGSMKHEFMLIERVAPGVELVPDTNVEGYQPAWKLILRDVAKKHGLEPSMLRRGSRKLWIVTARHEACYRLHTETTLSMTQIAAKLGYCDHSPVHHGIQKHKARNGFND